MNKKQSFFREISCKYRPGTLYSIVRYYVVEDNTEHSITLRGGDKNGTFNTYDKARKSLSATSTLADMVDNIDPLKVNALFH